SSVRDIEQRIQKAEHTQQHLPAGVQIPSGIPTKTEEHIRVMFDLLTLGFQTDTTRIATFMMAHDGSNRAFPEIGGPAAHHHISHHQRDPIKLDKIAKIDRFYVEQLAYFLNRLKTTREGEASLLDRSMIVYGAGISDGDAHDHPRLPVILAGRGGGTLNP